MANSIQVTPKTLNNKANELKNLNNRFKAQYESLKHTESSLNGMWEGEAKTAFHNAFTSDITQMHNFYNAIEKYVQTLHQIAAEYQKAESRNVSTASTRKYK
jgi:WXG100 family type VII secretion target